MIARVRAGEAEAYAQLVRAHTGVALRAAVAFGAGADAEDVVQSAFLKAYQSLGGFREGAAFRPWLLRIVVNETRNTVRSAGRARAVAGRERWPGARRCCGAPIRRYRSRRIRRWRRSRRSAGRC